MTFEVILICVYIIPIIPVIIGVMLCARLGYIDDYDDGITAACGFSWPCLLIVGIFILIHKGIVKFVDKFTKFVDKWAEQVKMIEETENRYPNLERVIPIPSKDYDDPLLKKWQWCEDLNDKFKDSHFITDPYGNVIDLTGRMNIKEL